jgi:hypothetical protein
MAFERKTTDRLKFESRRLGLRAPALNAIGLTSRLQLRTVKEVMEGKGIEKPSGLAARDETFKKAPESKKKQHEQKALEL